MKTESLNPNLETNVWNNKNQKRMKFVLNEYILYEQVLNLENYSQKYIVMKIKTYNGTIIFVYLLRNWYVYIEKLSKYENEIPWHFIKELFTIIKYTYPL